MTGFRRLAVAALGLALAGCASAPIHYYTLVAPAGALPIAAPAAPTQFELLPVGIPAQADRPQLLVRRGAQDVVPLEGERWIAPLADEARAALAADLARELNAEDASGMPAGGRLRLRIRVDLRRFDSVPGAYALIEATWSVSALAGRPAATGSAVIRESVGAGYDALVQGHQRALARLAAEIAATARSVAGGQGR
ncbi:MAG: PqiC family protein [Burkholderiales bacterium]